MARQPTFSRNFKLFAGAVLAGIGLCILSGAFAGPSAVFSSLLSVAAREALDRLPSILLVVVQAVSGYAVDHLQPCSCPLQMLVSCWPLLRVLAGAA